MSEFEAPVAEDPETVVTLRREGEHVAIVTLNRPRSRNAVSTALTRGLAARVRAVEDDPSIRVAILTGAGTQAFCAGADLKEMSAGATYAQRSTPDGGFAGFVFAPRRKLWIAAVNGAAVAGGFELMLACDMAVASRAAIFGLPEVKRGLAATAGGIYRLPRRVPRGIALEMIATGEPIDAARAQALGLVNHVVDPDQVLETAVRIARQVGANAPLAVALSLELARRADELDDVTLRGLAREVTERIHASEDAKEGPLAFAERRQPVWRGR
ncbi:enoyl-CoA hydratase-related protein [Piscinibacter sakaiensis]|uniref:Enoyl-CoA hydratase n=1 Tax=Piscinibacter sakaiensis TaxID=1547922 RepID=A0A0K8P6F1_PISS1|nr:enoyl-CoA hydratase-related protein [Piscinibacter sakaiensis]GAP38114.1 enoyl-CoA hydratase [Piscinibacter sakaiensis]